MVSCISTENFHSENYCLLITSSNDQTLCRHIFSSVGPNKWSGGKIEVKYNDIKIAELPPKFTEFQHCFDIKQLNVQNDRIKLQSTNGNGVCITRLSLNNTDLLFGKNNNLSSFWIDKNDKYCSNDSMSTSEITIQNKQVISSSCKPANQDDVLYADHIETKGWKKLVHVMKNDNLIISDNCDIELLVLPKNAENWVCNKAIQSNHIAKNSKCRVLCKTGYQVAKGKIKV